MQYLREVNGKIFGMIRPAGDGSIRVYTLNGCLRGIYRPHNDMTYDPNGHVVGYGNLLATLVWPE